MWLQNTVCLKEVPKEKVKVVLMPNVKTEIERCQKVMTILYNSLVSHTSSIRTGCTGAINGGTLYTLSYIILYNVQFILKSLNYQNCMKCIFCIIIHLIQHFRHSLYTIVHYTV